MDLTGCYQVLIFVLEGSGLESLVKSKTIIRTVLSMILAFAVSGVLVAVGSGVSSGGEVCMTGGGSVFTADGTRVTHGFELHGSPSQGPNNLEVNWGKGNKFHLEKLTSASCTDDPHIVPNPPPAGFDTYVGEGTGRYNGVSGATAKWTFTDAGEPGKNDFAEIEIWDAGGALVLSVSGNLDSGNHQAHAKCVPSPTEPPCGPPYPPCEPPCGPPCEPCEPPCCPQPCPPAQPRPPVVVPAPPPSPPIEWQQIFKRLSELEVRVQKLELEQAKLEMEVNKLRADLNISIQRLETEIRSVRDHAAQEAERLRYRIAQVEAEAAKERQRLEQNINQVQQYAEQKVRALQNEIERVERRAAEEVSRLQRLIQLCQQQADGKIQKLEQQIAGLQRETDRRVLALEGQLQGVRNEMSLYASRISALEGQVPQLKEQVSVLKDKVSQLEMKVAALEAKVTKLILLDP